MNKIGKNVCGSQTAVLFHYASFAPCETWEMGNGQFSIPCLPRLTCVAEYFMRLKLVPCCSDLTHSTYVEIYTSLAFSRFYVNFYSFDASTRLTAQTERYVTAFQ